MIYTELTETVQNGDFGTEKYPPPLMFCNPDPLV